MKKKEESRERKNDIALIGQDDIKIDDVLPVGNGIQQTTGTTQNSNKNPENQKFATVGQEEAAQIETALVADKAADSSASQTQ